MSAQLGTCGCLDVPKTLTPGTAIDASETSQKRMNRATYTFFGAPKTQFTTFAEKYAWMKGRAACTGNGLCLNTTS